MNTLQIFAIVILISIFGGLLIFAYDAIRANIASRRELSSLDKAVLEFSDTVMKFYDQFSPFRFDPLMRQCADLDEEYEILFRKKIVENGIEVFDIIWHYGALLNKVENYSGCLKESTTLSEFQYHQVSKKISQYENHLKTMVSAQIKTSYVKKCCSLLLNSYKQTDFAYPCLSSNELEMLPHIVYRLEQKIADGRFDSITDYELSTGSRFLLRMNIYLAYKDNDDFKKKFSSSEATLLGYTYKNDSFEYVIGALNGRVLSYLKYNPLTPAEVINFTSSDKRDYKKRVKKATNSKDIIELLNCL